eukprot:6002014-Amphidinium_carterae.1
MIHPQTKLKGEIRNHPLIVQKSLLEGERGHWAHMNGLGGGPEIWNWPQNRLRAWQGQCISTPNKNQHQSHPQHRTTQLRSGLPGKSSTAGRTGPGGLTALKKAAELPGTVSYTHLTLPTILLV